MGRFFVLNYLQIDHLPNLQVIYPLLHFEIKLKPHLTNLYGKSHVLNRRGSLKELGELVPLEIPDVEKLQRSQGQRLGAIAEPD